MIAPMPLFLGLDCGGTTTRAMVVDDSGRTVFEGQGGCANLATTPRDVLASSLRQALLGAPRPDAAVGCFAGLVSDAEERLAAELFKDLGLDSMTAFRPDYWAALAACSDGTDAVVVAGTGSIIASWDGKDNVRKSGGGGPLFGDQGSAFDVARRAIRSVFIDRIERGTTRLQDALRSLLGTDDPGVVVSGLNRGCDVPSRVASLAPTVGSDAAEGVPYAVGAVQGAMSDLARSVRRHVGPSGRIALAGGLWDAHPVFPTVFISALGSGNESGPTSRPIGQYHVERLTRRPVYGAARLAQLLFHGH